MALVELGRRHDQARTDGVAQRRRIQDRAVLDLLDARTATAKVTARSLS